MSGPTWCPNCSSNRVNVLYSAPLQYECVSCEYRWTDARPAVEVLTGDDGKSKRPALYGLPACKCCGHEPHPDAPCRWCARDRA